MADLRGVVLGPSSSAQLDDAEGMALASWLLGEGLTTEELERVEGIYPEPGDRPAYVVELAGGERRFIAPSHGEAPVPPELWMADDG